MKFFLKMCAVCSTFVVLYISFATIHPSVIKKVQIIYGAAIVVFIISVVLLFVNEKL